MEAEDQVGVGKEALAQDEEVEETMLATIRTIIRTNSMLLVLAERRQHLDLCLLPLLDL